MRSQRRIFMNKVKQSEYHPKGWGYELWIANSDKYCGKLLFFNKGKKCSYHYHRRKTETFYIQSGKILLRYGERNEIEEAEEVILGAGDVFDVPQLLRHQMEAVEDTELFEFSTYHSEGDSYRVVKGD